MARRLARRVRRPILVAAAPTAAMIVGGRSGCNTPAARAAVPRRAVMHTHPYQERT